VPTLLNIFLRLMAAINKKLEDIYHKTQLLLILIASIQALCPTHMTQCGVFPTFGFHRQLFPQGYTHSFFPL
jgi:hypothetical protein